MGLLESGLEVGLTCGISVLGLGLQLEGLR